MCVSTTPGGKFVEPVPVLCLQQLFVLNLDIHNMVIDGCFIGECYMYIVLDIHFVLMTTLRL